LQQLHFFSGTLQAQFPVEAALELLHLRDTPRHQETFQNVVGYTFYGTGVKKKQEEGRNSTL